MTEETTMDGGQGQAIEVRQEFRPTTQRALLTREALNVDLEQRKLLGEYVHKLMVKGSDYGEIPGTNKPTLLKPGAEKLVDLFRCTPEFTLVKADEDFDKGHGFFNYVFRVRLLNRESGVVLAEGFGSANSREGRYRWRNASPKCPRCGAEALLLSKDKPEFFCWRKKSGCGATFPKSSPEVANLQAGKVENEDVATLANTILKMAKKRALVDGAIALARCSDMFTQDVEDFVDHAPQEDYAPPPQREESASAPVAKPQAAPKVAPKAKVPAGVPAVRFGPHKGRGLHELTAEEFADVAEKGHAVPSDIQAEQERRALEPGATG